MNNPRIRFKNGAAYERYMGQWSQLVGQVFLAWLAVPTAQRWLDVGCGNGAFTEMLIAHAKPSEVHGIDPSEPQLEYARTRPALQQAQLLIADAMALPYPAQRFDVAVMPLVIFFVPEPASGVAEMRRVVRPGGWVAAYAWDMEGGGFPYAALQAEISAEGFPIPAAPSADASRLDAMQALWKEAGLEQIESRPITVERSFADFEDFWTTVQGAPSVGGLLNSMDQAQREAIRERMRARLPADAQGRIRYSARANAIKGRVPDTRQAKVSMHGQ